MKGLIVAGVMGVMSCLAVSEAKASEMIVSNNSNQVNTELMALESAGISLIHPGRRVARIHGHKARKRVRKVRRRTRRRTAAVLLVAHRICH